MTTKVKSEETAPYKYTSETAPAYEAAKIAPPAVVNEKTVDAILTQFERADIKEAAKRILKQDFFQTMKLTSPALCVEYLQSQMSYEPREQFRIIYLNTRHAVISDEVLFYGTLNGATVNPREVAKAVLLHNAAAVIISHNHPSGVAEPSQADISLTVKLKEALLLIECRLLDHIVVAGSEFVSLSDRGLI